MAAVASVGREGASRHCCSQAFSRKAALPQPSPQICEPFIVGSYVVRVMAVCWGTTSMLQRAARLVRNTYCVL